VIVLGYPITYLELSCALTGLTAVFLAAKSSIWNWPMSIISQILWFIFYSRNGLYGNMTLQLYFTAICMYGWYNWSKEDGKLIKKLKLKSKLILSSVLTLLCIIGGYVLSLYQPEYPYIDATITLSSVLAIFLISRKYIEAWYLWLIVDILYIILFYMKGFYLITIEEILITCIAIYGYFNWLNLFKKQKTI
jgi:nicotinamide mononucleotide transporter